MTPIAPFAGQQRLPARGRQVLGAAEVGVQFLAASSEVGEDRDADEHDDQK